MMKYLRSPPPRMPSPSHRTQFVIGLAGHIDHGKSAIVQALTGSKTDRLPEEQKRGITIDLGFAHFDATGKRFALIDVPGHERFIHTMVAGASGVDVAVLVVAADDAVMPQTREHLALLQMLGVRRGVIAISKCDLANDELLELVELEIAELVAGTFLADAPRVRVSALNGSGIAELRSAIVAAALVSPTRNTDDARFRMPIDRAFSPAGQGAVVTGTVWHGTARVGDTLDLLPAGESVRIRRLQSQGKDVESVTAGERAAINLVGVKASAIQRGNELATPETLEPAKRILVQLRMLPDARQPLKHRQLLRLHLGANQASAQVLLDQRDVAAGQTAFAVIRTSTPIVAEYGQPFILRQLSPAATIGGGTILAPALRVTDKLKRSLAVAEGLASPTAPPRLAAFIELRKEVIASDISLTATGLTSAERDVALQKLLQQKEIIAAAGPQPSYVTAKRFAQLKQRLLRHCRAELERRKPAAQVSLTAVLAPMNRHASPALLQKLLAEMVTQREIIHRGERIGLPSGAELSQRQRQQLATLLTQLVTAGRAPPTFKELAELTKIPQRDLEQLLQVAIDEGQLVKLSPQLAMDREALEGIRQSLADYFQRQATAKVGDLREQWGITRKHAVPIFEFFDDCGITLRKDDLRTPGPRLLLPIGEAHS